MKNFERDCDVMECFSTWINGSIKLNLTFLCWWPPCWINSPTDLSFSFVSTNMAAMLIIPFSLEWLQTTQRKKSVKIWYCLKSPRKYVLEEKYMDSKLALTETSTNRHSLALGNNFSSMSANQKRWEIWKTYYWQERYPVILVQEQAVLLK